MKVCAKKKEKNKKKKKNSNISRDQRAYLPHHLKIKLSRLE